MFTAPPPNIVVCPWRAFSDLHTCERSSTAVGVSKHRTFCPELSPCSPADKEGGTAIHLQRGCVTSSKKKKKKQLLERSNCFPEGDEKLTDADKIPPSQLPFPLCRGYDQCEAAPLTFHPQSPQASSSFRRYRPDLDPRCNKCPFFWSAEGRE